MSREIKFRGISKSNPSEKVYVSLEYLMEPVTTIGYWYDGYWWNQFTGLLSESGKKIYEGDILKITTGHNNTKEPTEQVIIGAITYTEPYAMFGIHGVAFDLMSLFPREIIGNIYENENLLK